VLLAPQAFKSNRITRPNLALPLKKSNHQKNAGGGLSLPCNKTPRMSLFLLWYGSLMRISPLMLTSDSKMYANGSLPDGLDPMPQFRTNCKK
jgi:hypothetical protein